MTTVTRTIDASRVKRILCVAAVGSALVVPLVVAPVSDARSRFSQAMLGGTDQPGVKQPRPDGVGSLGSEVISAADKVLNAGSMRMRATTKR